MRLEVSVNTIYVLISKCSIMKKIMKKRIALAAFSGLTALSLVGCYATLRADKLFYSGGVNTPAVEFVDSL